eukprot:TRINITY_DN1645_c0_g1_i1.p1 TRINITY_DN1645_c0_g1~~TRINITY_DN1645_c0_g1_i1.p1  ORF type:complete len:148 (+),score=34.03 TRINITY_DN1645_c0_g1_i1:66-509(+)
MEEPPETNVLSKKEKKIVNEFYKSENSSGGTWNEKYESTVSQQDKPILKFQRRLSRCPQQILRYNFNGEPLWFTNKKPASIPKCKSCGAARVFELQLMPALLYLLKPVSKEEGRNFDFGTVLFFTCSSSCYTGDLLTDEYYFVQDAI